MLSSWLRKLKQCLVSSSSTQRRPRPRTSVSRLQLERLEDRLAPATFAWTGLGGGGNFSNPSNWSNVATNTPGTPGNGDSLVFPLNGPSAPGTVTDDLLGTTNFASITFLSGGWTVAASAGDTVGITSAINDTTSIAGTNTITAPLSFAAATSSVGLNVVNPAGAAVNQLNLNGAIALGTAGFTFSGFGKLMTTGVVSGAGSVVANSSGTLTLSAADTYTGSTTITSGIVVAATNAAALGTGTVTVNNGGTLQLNVTGVSNALNLNGLGFGGNGALVDTGNGFVYGGNITLQTSSSINIGAGDNFVLSGNAAQTATGTISGPGGLTVVGPNSATLTDEDMGTYTGVTNILGPALPLFSQAGQAGTGGQNTGTSGYVVSQGGALASANQNAVTNNRIGTSAFVELDGGTLDINLNGGASTETFAALNLGNAAPGIIGSDTVNLGANNNTVNVGTINRFPGSTVTFLGSNIGTTNTITFGAFGAGAGLVNGILPYADVANGAAPATDFATQNLNGNTGIGIAASIAAPVANGGAGNGLENIKLTGNVTLTQDTFVNSLNLNGNQVIFNGFRLIVGSGGLMDSGTGSGVIFSPGELDFGTTALAQGGNPTNTPFPADGALIPVEGIITNAAAGGQLYAAAPIIVGNNLTFNLSPTGNSGSLFYQGSPANSTYTGVTWVTSGSLTLSNDSVNVIPGTLVIGDNAGGQGAQTVSIFSNGPQFPTGALGNVIINSSGELSLIANDNQSVGNLTLNSGLNQANANIATGTLTVTGTITSGGVTLSPAAGLPDNALPDVSDFMSSLIQGSGNLILAPASGTTTVFNVGKTPAVSGGGEVDLILSLALGAGSATLDKQGAGVLDVRTLPLAGYTGTVQIDGGTFAPGVANFAQNIVVDSGGTLGNDSVAGGTTTGSITVNGGTVNPGLPASPLAPSNSQNGEYLNTGTATTPDFSAGGILALHIDGYGTTTDWDQFQGTTAANQVTLGGTSILDLDLLGLVQWGTLTGKVVNGTGASPFIWMNQLIGKFSNAPNANNILPAANVLNNPTGFQAIVSYGGGFITVVLAHPSVVGNSTFVTDENTPLTVSTAATGVLANATNPDFNGAVSEATLTTVSNPGTFTGSHAGQLAVNANGTFTYTPAAGFSGTETFTLTATDPRGTLSAPFTVSFTVNTPIVLSPPTLPGGAFGAHYNQAITASGGTGAITLAVNIIANPTGLNISGNGTNTITVSGTPTSPGTVSFTVTPTDAVTTGPATPYSFTVTQPPSITSAASTTFTVGTPGSFTITTGPDFPTATTLSDGGASLPSNVTFVDNGNGTATLSGTPAVGTGGTYSFTLTASNGVVPSASQPFTLTVDEAPSITSASSATFTVGTPGSFTVTTGPDFPTVTLSDGGASLPSNVTFVNDTFVDHPNGTATLAGTPAVGTGGTYNFTITASNGVAPDATQPFTLTVNAAPSITSAPSTTFTVGTPGSFTITTGPDFPTATTLSDGGASLPANVTFVDNGNGTATLSGTPAPGTGGTYTFTLTASNGVLPVAMESFTLTVNAAPSITSANGAFFTVGTPGSITITTGPDFPTATTLSDGGASLPANVTFVDNGNGTATLAGTPAVGTGGTYSFTITASNGIAPDAAQPFTLTVNSEAPAITSANNASFSVGTAGSFTVTATGFSTATTFSESGALPSAVTFNASTGVLSGIPVDGTAGTYPLTFTASNSVGMAVTQSFTLTVLNSPPPTIVFVNPAFTGAPGTTPSGAPATTIIGVNAFATIQQGLTFVATSGTVEVAAGTYTENLTIARSVIVQGAGSATTILSGQNGGIGVDITTANGVALSGLTVKGYVNPLVAGVTSVSGQAVSTTYLSLSDVQFVGNEFGGSIVRVATVLLTGSGNDTFFVTPEAVAQPGNNPLYYVGTQSLTIDGGSGTNSLDVFLNDSSAADTVWVSAIGIARVQAPFVLFYRDTGGTFGGGVNVVLGSAPDTIVVLSQQAGAPTTIYADDGADTFNVAVTTGSAYQNLTLDAGSGPATVGVFDQSGGATGKVVGLPDGTLDFVVSYASGSTSTIHEQNFQQPALATTLVTM